MDKMRYDRLNSLMNLLPPSIRYRWCDKGFLIGCKCVHGCADVMGALSHNGFTKADWEYWVKRNNGMKTPEVFFTD